MKRFVCTLVGCLLFTLTSCMHTTSTTGTPITTSDNNVTSVTPSTQLTAATTAAYSPCTLTPTQGGNMLYPTFSKFPTEILSGYVSYVPEMIGIINQDGSIIASPQYTSFVYYKNAENLIQYIIVAGNGKVTIYTLDGSVYMELEAENVFAVNGFPFLKVGIHTFFGGPGSEPRNTFTVYDLRTGEKVLDQNYNTITFIDSHTALLQNYGKFKNDTFEFIDTYLYDFSGNSKKAVKMDGYIEDYNYIPPFPDTVTRIPATDKYVFPGDAEPPATQHGFLDRSGHWVSKSEESSGVKPAENEYKDTYYCRGLNDNKSFEDHYFWVIEGDYQGYQNKNGMWLYREDAQSRFLED